MYRPRCIVVLGVALGVALALAAAGCSGNGGSEQATAGPTSSPTSVTSPTSSQTSTAPATAAVVTAADLDGTSYVSTMVTGHDLVAGTAIDLGFDAGTLSVSAGCNSMFGEYEVDDQGMLRWTGHPASTMKACADELMAQDQWLAQLFTDGVAATKDGSDLTLTSGEVTIELGAKTATTDLTSLLGRTWTVVGTMSGGATQRVPRRNRLPRLEVGRDGVSRLDTGCNTGRTIVRVDGDAFVFGPTTVTRQHCPQPDREIERRVLAVLDGRTDTVDTNGTALIITKAPGGLVIQVR
jgi:heat shock protein HslJ